MSFEIGKVLETGEPLFLKVKDVVASRTYIASETRFGKSHTARRIVEEILENWVGRVGVIIIDLEGEYASLREKYSILIIGRDIPIQVETPTLLASTAEFMAQQILETGTSAIIDLSVVEDFEDGKEYVDKFLRRFFHLQTIARKPYLVIEEEAEDLAPESGAPGTRTCLEISVNLGKRGGKRGIGVLYVGHRPAWITKGILSQCPNKAIGRIEQPDMKALEEYARIPHNIVEKLVPKTNEKGEIIESGPDRGVFCFTGDWVKKTTFVKVGPVKTTHLGATPEIIPRPMGDIEGVIKNVRKALSQVIEKTKPVIASQAEMESKVKAELENKYKGRIETLQRTAEERAERKYKAENERLHLELEKISRAQALQPTAPITNVLEHPIVRARMLQLDDKAKDLLTKIEKEPDRTREELAAFLITSKDAVANLIEKINRTFQVTVIVGEGKPIRYKSMLKRLYITDVGKREIAELERLQTDNKLKQEKITGLENKVTSLQSAAQQNVTLHSEVTTLTTERNKALDRLGKQDLEMKEVKNRNEVLAKENEAFQKIKEGFQALGITTSAVAPIDEEKVKAIVEAKVKELVLEDSATSLLSEKQIDAMVEKHVKDLLSNIEEMIKQKVAERMPTGQETIDLEHKQVVVDIHHAGEEHVKMGTTTDKGKILYCVVNELPKEGFTYAQLQKELLENGWSISKAIVYARLKDLTDEGSLIKVNEHWRLPTKVQFNIEKIEG